MNTYIRISDISESMAEDIAIKFNHAIPGFCEDTGKHAFEKDLYSFFLSSDDDYGEVMEKLSKLSETLLYAKNSGAYLWINSCVHVSDYRNSRYENVGLPSELLQLAVRIGAELEVSFFVNSPCWNCPKNEDDEELLRNECACPQVVAPSKNKTSNPETA